MSHATAHPLLARLAVTLASREPARAERDEPFFEAAVSLILRPRTDDDCDLLLIRRAAREGDPWSGQIGLPGGRMASRDASLEATAIRETREEVGLDLSRDGQVLGALGELRPRTPVLPPIIVRPYVVALIGDDRTDATTSEEVAEVRWVSLRGLFAPEARVRTQVQVREHRLSVGAIQLGDFTIWGMTERILSGLEELVR